MAMERHECELKTHSVIEREHLSNILAMYLNGLGNDGNDKSYRSTNENPLKSICD